MNYNPFSIEGKQILITGASSGIGRTTSIECSKMGAKVIITGRNQERLQETYDQLTGTDHVQIIADLCTEAGINQILDSLPVIDGIVNNAGIGKIAPFQFIKSTDLMEIFNTNFFSAVSVTQQLVKKKKLGKNGSIVFVSSIDGPVTTHVGNSMYAASKGALTAMAKNMAVDLAGKNIRVNCVLPGTTETPLIHGIGLTQEQLSEDMKLFPMRRYGKPEEIAYAIIYFLSEASSWTTGSNLVVDGGFTLI
ncbi:MAG: SDR family oxidoreductase [Bacteroidota bacterium]